MFEPKIEVGWHKGEIDFWVNSSICELTFEQMQELRAMICTAIGTAEQMWRDGQKRGEGTAKCDDGFPAPYDAKVAMCTSSDP